MNKLLLFLILLVTLDVQSQSQSQFNGFALYNAQNNNTTYLIDKEGDIAHTWNCDLNCNYTVLLKNNGNIVRGAVNPGNQLGGADEGGRVQEIDPYGNIVWEFTYSDNTHLSHHDITLVNDNVLLTAWEVKSTNQLTQAGYDGATTEKWPTHFVEVAHDGSGGGEIVWEWHIWDHLIQNHDETKDNYGVVADHPELIDINMIQAGGSGGPGGDPGGGPGGGPGGSSGDWFCVNGVNYNAELDQIAFSSRHASEIYIIDHSTTTAEAAGHTGGNSGMGGDIIYRWGNPSNYGTPGLQQIPSAVHDVRWITNDGRPNGGFLQFFNNNGGENYTSTVDAIETPLDGYNYTLEPGQAYGPSTFSWTHTCNGYASNQSASHRMSNGNVFVNLSGAQGGAGYMYEADSLGNIVWQYNAGGTPKAFRYECDDPGIIALIGNIEIESDCATLIVEGCTDNTALNYDEIANTDDGSCIEMVYGCIDNDYVEYNNLANTDDGSCQTLYSVAYAEVTQENEYLQEDYNFYQDLATISLSSLQQALDTWNTTIDLSSGWNMIGYGCPNPIDLVEGLSNHTESILIVKDNNGEAYLPEWNFNGIGDLIPGFGYQIKVTEAIEDFSLCDWYVNDIPEDNIVSLQDSLQLINSQIGCADSLACNYDVNKLYDDDSCEFADEGYDCDGNITAEIGDIFEGGYLFYIDETGQHGLVAAMVDLTLGASDPYEFGYNGYEWGCYNMQVTGADGTEIGSGYQNTVDIVNFNCTTINGQITAAQASLNFESEGYDDWFLPSKQELIEMFNNITPGADESNNGFDLYDFPFYWSSSEHSNQHGTLTYFNDANGHLGGYTNGNDKNNTCRVRPIRSF